MDWLGLRCGSWRSFEAVEFTTLEWVDWFNNRRLLEPIGSIPPAEAKERHYAMHNEQKLAAYSNETAWGKHGAVQKAFGSGVITHANWRGIRDLW